MDEKYIAVLDIGTTTVRCFIFKTNTEIVGQFSENVVLIYPEPGFVEIDPDQLWNSILIVINGALKDANLSLNQITCLGISTQRGTFVTWSKKTGQHFHRFVTWKDLRADRMVKEWNDSLMMKSLRTSSLLLFYLMRSKRFKAGSVLKLMNTQTTLRLAWILKNNSALKEAIQLNDAMFGTVDTWLLYKLTGGRLHVSDASSAAATGFFDPFTMQWAQWALSLFSIPSSILPTVVDSGGHHYGDTSHKVLGAEIPILTSIADQSASLWGSCCFEPGDMKLTMGTGTFLNINTGKQPHASISGLYPLVAWKLGSEVVYMAEGANNDTGSIIKWSHSIGLFDDPGDSSHTANSVPGSDGVYFVPAFSGLGPPINDSTTATGFIGIKPSTNKSHLVRAILESIVFRSCQLYQCAKDEINMTFTSIRLDGGVSNNDFIAQLLSDMTGLTVYRSIHSDMSSLGVLYMAGLHLGVWKSKEEIKNLYKVGTVFRPREHNSRLYENILVRWSEATTRLAGWYDSKHTIGTGSAVANNNGKS